jgi:hypothetical protein
LSGRLKPIPLSCVIAQVAALGLSKVSLLADVATPRLAKLYLGLGFETRARLRYLNDEYDKLID